MDTTTINTRNLSSDNEDEEWWEKAYMAEPVEPYTMEEIYERLARSEKDIADGRHRPFAEAMADFWANHARKKTMNAETEQEFAVAV